MVKKFFPLSRSPPFQKTSTKGLRLLKTILFSAPSVSLQCGILCLPLAGEGGPLAVDEAK